MHVRNCVIGATPKFRQTVKTLDASTDYRAHIPPCLIKPSGLEIMIFFLYFKTYVPAQLKRNISFKHPFYSYFLKDFKFLNIKCIKNLAGYSNY